MYTDLANSHDAPGNHDALIAGALLQSQCGIHTVPPEIEARPP